MEKQSRDRDTSLIENNMNLSMPQNENIEDEFQLILHKLTKLKSMQGKIDSMYSKISNLEERCTSFDNQITNLEIQSEQFDWIKNNAFMTQFTSKPFFIDYKMPAIKVCDADEEADFYQVLQSKMTEFLENSTENVSSNEISLSTMQSSNGMDDSFAVDETIEAEEEVDPVDVKQQIEIWEDRLTTIANRCQAEKDQMEKLRLEKLLMEQKRLEQKQNAVFSISSDEAITPITCPSLHSQQNNISTNNNYDDFSEKDHMTYNSEISIDTLDGVPSLNEDVQNFNDIVNSFEDKKVPDLKHSSIISSSANESKSNKPEGENYRRSMSLSFDKDSPLKSAANKLVIYFKGSSRPESPSKSLSPSSSIGSEQITYNQHQVNVT